MCTSIIRAAELCGVQGAGSPGDLLSSGETGPSPHSSEKTNQEVYYIIHCSIILYHTVICSCSGIMCFFCSVMEVRFFENE